MTCDGKAMTMNFTESVVWSNGPLRLAMTGKDAAYWWLAATLETADALDTIAKFRS